DSLPQVLRIGPGDETSVDYLRIAQEIIGQADSVLFSEEDMEAIRGRLGEIQARIAEREQEISELVDEAEEPQGGEAADEELVEEIRQSVSDDVIDEHSSQESDPSASFGGGRHEAPSSAEQQYTQNPPRESWRQPGP